MQFKVKIQARSRRRVRDGEESIKGKGDQVFNATFRKFLKKAEDVASDNADFDASAYVMTEESNMIPVFFRNLKGYDAHIIIEYITREYALSSVNAISPPSPIIY